MGVLSINIDCLNTKIYINDNYKYVVFFDWE